MSAAPPTVLESHRQSLALPLVFAVMLHLCAGGSMWLGSWLGARDARPVIDLERTMSVSVIAKSDTKMVQKASKAPAVASNTTAPPPPNAKPAPKGAAAPSNTAAPPPSSDLKIHNPKAQTQQGTPDRAAERAAAVRQMLMQQLVEDAAEGDVNRQAGDPNSTAAQSINPGGASFGDPEIAKYEKMIQDLFKPLFKPLPATFAGKPEIFCIVHLEVEMATGRILKSWIHTSSGNPSYDNFAIRAVNQVPAVPLPPERFAARYANGYKIRFTPPT